MAGNFKYGLAGGFFLGVIATITLAQISPSNPYVMKRVDAMNRIAAETKLIGQMARGIKPFDATRARAAAAIVAAESANIPELFRDWQSDRASEALPAIWKNFDDFTSRAAALQKAAQKSSGSISSANDVAAAAASLGGACKSCHERYRK